MKRIILSLLLCLAVFCGSSLGQSGACTTGDHTEYTKKIKEYTTEPVFSTELVDHLPYNSSVPAPDAALHHSIGAPDVLDYTKDINAYMRLLASKSPSGQVFTIGTSAEGRDRWAAVLSGAEKLP